MGDIRTVIMQKISRYEGLVKNDICAGWKVYLFAT